MKYFNTSIITFVSLAISLLMLPSEGQTKLTWKINEGNVLNQPASWFASKEARQIAKTVLYFQRKNGGWPKNKDMIKEYSGTEINHIKNDRRDKDTTFDNGSTYTHIRFLARVNKAQPNPKYEDAIRRGLEFTLSAQYPNGGFPQQFPNRKGYAKDITFNDDAMTGVMNLLFDVAHEQSPFNNISSDIRARASTALSKGIDCILKAQIRTGGKLTAWAQQYDHQSLKPTWARAFEPPSISSRESVSILEFLMRLPNPSAEIKTAIHHGVQWLNDVKIRGIRVVDEKESSKIQNIKQHRGYDRVVKEDASAPPIWARLYRIEDNKPLFISDKKIKYKLEDISYDRRTGYSWYGYYATKLLSKDYPRWKARHGGQAIHTDNGEETAGAAIHADPGVTPSKTSSINVSPPTNEPEPDEVSKQRQNDEKDDLHYQYNF